MAKDSKDSRDPKGTKGPVQVPVRIALTGAAADDRLDLLQAVVFDRLGQVAASTRLKVSRQGDKLVAEGGFSASPEQLASARLVVAPVPPQGGDVPPSRETLERQLRGYTEPIRIDLRKPCLELQLGRPYWEPWTLLCACWIRGRLVKRVQLTGGQVLELPICHARVTICEVDRFRLIVDKLPLPDLYRLRDELLELIERPLPIPLPEPEPWFSPLAASQVLAFQPPRAALRQPAPQPIALALADASPAALRADLVAQFEVFRPWLCGLGWLEPWFLYTTQCLAPVMTDEMGRFSVLYVHDCHDTDQPDLHIRAEQLIGGGWVTIHNPPLRCHTIWNYVCGDEITVVVTDERAQPCVPDVPVDPPAGVDRWVMPMAVGDCWIRGTAGGAAPAGWVRPDGLLDYGSTIDAPFGSTLGFRQQHALNIPDTAPGQPALYRWSWRRQPGDDWIHMTAPVSRTYVRDLPGPAVQFPSVQLGPGADDTFRFKTALFNPADWGVSTTGDPGGTSYYWPVDNSIGDVYAARWTTPGSSDVAAAPALAGTYQVRLEVLDSARNVILPGAATFQFVVPSSWDGLTLDTRVAAPSEIVDGGFVFTVHVDNSRCDAAIDPPQVVGGAGVDACGFLRYTPGSTVRLAFDALHPAQRATYTFGVVRGALGVGAAGAGGEVGAAASGAFAGNGAGHFVHDFPVGTLMGPLPGHPGSCDNAAFAASLQVHAKAHSGTSRIQAYDDGALRAFALAQ